MTFLSSVYGINNDLVTGLGRQDVTSDETLKSNLTIIAVGNILPIQHPNRVVCSLDAVDATFTF